MNIISSPKVPNFDKESLDEFSRKMTNHFRRKNRIEKLNKLNMKKMFALIPKRTIDNEIVWLKYLNVKYEIVNHEYEFTIFGGLTSISISYDKKKYSKIK